MDALKFVKIKQVTVAGDDVLAGSLKCGSENVIVFRIVGDGIKGK